MSKSRAYTAGFVLFLTLAIVVGMFAVMFGLTGLIIAGEARAFILMIACILGIVALACYAAGSACLRRLERIILSTGSGSVIPPRASFTATLSAMTPPSSPEPFQWERIHPLLCRSVK